MTFEGQPRTPENSETTEVEKSPFEQEVEGSVLSIRERINDLEEAVDFEAILEGKEEYPVELGELNENLESLDSYQKMQERPFWQEVFSDIRGEHEKMRSDLDKEETQGVLTNLSLSFLGAGTGAVVAGPAGMVVGATAPVFTRGLALGMAGVASMGKRLVERRNTTKEAKRTIEGEQ